jgi:hypothetical protein
MALAAPVATQAAPDLSGVWWPMSRDEAVRPLVGPLPLRPEANAAFAAAREARTQALKANDLGVRCRPVFPGLMRDPLPIQILQRPELMLMVHARNHTVRFIYMNEPPDKDADPAYVGHSTGHWDGDTLVIETVAINEKGAVDKTGLPHSPDLAVTERLRLIDGGRRLEDRMTLDDPKTFTAPWSSVVVFERRPGTDLMQNVCTLDTPTGTSR